MEKDRKMYDAESIKCLMLLSIRIEENHIRFLEENVKEKLVNLQ